MSSEFPSTPAVKPTKEAVDPLAGLTPVPDSTVNYASDPATVLWVTQNLKPVVNEAESEGQSARSEWNDVRAMLTLQHDEHQNYIGQSNIYLPLVQRAVETRASAICRALFPTDTYLDGDSNDPNVTPEEREIAKAWMRHQLEKNAKVRPNLKVFVRQMLAFGPSYLKFWWEGPAAIKRGKRLSPKALGDALLADAGGDYAGMEEDPFGESGARCQTVNAFNMYVWPKTANNIDECVMVAEDIEVSRQYAEEQVEYGNWPKEILDEGNAGSSQMSNQWAQTGLQQVGDPGVTASDSSAAGELATYLTITEVWTRMPLPSSAYKKGETDKCPVPVKVTLCGGKVLEVRRNPFWHQKPPYKFYKVNALPGMFNSVGMGRAMSGLQYAANDFINQTNDNGTYALNPVIIADPAKVSEELEPLKPGAIQWVSDINSALKFERPPVEQLQYGAQLAQQMIAYGNDFGGAPPQLQGTSSKGSAKTATGAQILEGNTKGEIQDLVEELELMVLEPLMHDIWTLGEQYETQSRWVAITGGQKVQFTPDMLQARYRWSWVASSQAVNRAQRTQAAMQFLQLAGSLMPLLQAQGKVLDPVPILRRIWEDGLGQRGFDAIVKQAPMAPPGMGPPGAGPPGAPPGAPPGQGPQDPRSATEQNPIGGGAQAGVMVPGEGEAFGEVRQQADALAALLGANGAVGGGEE